MDFSVIQVKRLQYRCIILYLNLFHQLAILALVEVRRYNVFLVACFGIDALSMPVVLSSILVDYVLLSSFRKALLLSTTTTVYKRTF
jgi:hypothetical protein